MFLAAIMVLSVVAMSAAFAGGAVADGHYDSDNYDVGPTLTTPDDVDTLWAGQEVIFGDEEAAEADMGHIDGTTLSIYEGPVGEDDPDRVTSLQIEDGATEELDTSDLDVDEPYHIGTNDDTDWDDTEFWVRSEELDTSFDASSVAEGDDDGTTLTFESERDVQVVNVTETSEGLDADEIDDVFSSVNDLGLDDDDDVAQFEVDLEGNDETELAVSTEDLEIGDYEFEFDVTDSLASDNASLEVADEAQDRGFVTNAVSEEQGNLVNITVTPGNSDEATVQFGDGEEEYFSSWADISIDDDEIEDEFVIQYNTHYPGTLAPWLGQNMTEIQENDEFDTINTAIEGEGVGFDSEYFASHGWQVPDEYEDDVTIENANTTTSWGYQHSDAFEGDLLPEALEGSFSLTLGDGIEQDDGEWEVSTIDDRGSVTLQQRTPPGEMYTEIAPGEDALTEWEDYEDTTATESSTAAAGDHVIGVVPGFGASGAIDFLSDAVGDNDGLLGPTVDNSGIYVTASQTGPDHATADWNSNVSVDDAPAGFDQEDGTFDNDEDNPLPLKGIVLDDYSGDLYVVIDYEEANMPADETYEATLHVDERSTYIPNEDSEIEMDLTLSLEEPDVTWDQTAAEVPASSNAEVTGTTNIAPGSEISTYADASNFYYNEDGDISADGTFTATYDFSDESEGTEFELVATAPSGYQVDGNDVEDDIDSILTEGTGKEPAEGIDVSVDHPSEITDGESADVTTTVKNHEDEELTVSLEYSVGGESFEEELTVAAGDSESVSQTIEGLEVDDHDVSATATADGVDDASYSGTLTVSEESDDEDTETDGEDDGDSEGQPGFGVAVALVALLAAAMIALRRQD